LLLKIRKNNKTITYKKLEYSDLFNNQLKLKIPKKNYITIFPQSPQSLEYNLGDAPIHDIYESSITQTVIDFINDIVNVGLKYNLNIIIKDKRKSYANDVLYEEFLKALSHNKKVYVIQEKVGIMKLIKNSIGCISFPITSTAEVASSLGVPSSYYTPSTFLNNSGPEFMNNDLLNNKTELDLWIKNLIDNNKKSDLYML
jgi:polysaccharide biosynthesis PFTS motif protein